MTQLYHVGDPVHLEDGSTYEVWDVRAMHGGYFYDLYDAFGEFEPLHNVPEHRLKRSLCACKECS